jgi:hypothetical protein
MKNLQQLAVKAQQEANRAQKPMAVLNLNRFQPLYVIREWAADMEGSPGLVYKIEPKASNAD